MVTSRVLLNDVLFYITHNNIHITDSYKLNKKQIYQFLKELRLDERYSMQDTPLDHRSDKSLVREWITHNNLYKLGLFKSRTKDVDLNYPQKRYMKVIYFIGSIIEL